MSKELHTLSSDGKKPTRSKCDLKENYFVLSRHVTYIVTGVTVKF